ncbi:MAG: choice-of-anchor P family protein [Actinomycetota bacterium]
MSRVSRGLALVISLIALVAGGSVANAQVGSQLASYYGPCSAGNGRAVAFHSGLLYYTNYDFSGLVYEVNASTGACVGSIPVVRPVASLTWDSKRNLFWGGAYDGSGDVITIDPSTGTSNVVFNTLASTAGDGSCCSGYIDGLAWDSSSDSLWFSNDLSVGSPTQTIFRFSPTGTVLQTFKVASINGYGNSGIAFDGSLLWLAFPVTNQILTFDRGTTGGALATPLGSFNTGSFETEGMTFDNQTFSPKCAVWINNAGYANYLTAYEVTCPLVADAYTVRLSIDGAPVPVRINAAGDARAVGENVSQSNSVQQVVLPMGIGTITLGDNSAVTSVDPSKTPLTGSAKAEASIASVNLLGGMVTGHAIRSVSTTSASQGSASSTDAGTDIAALNVGGNPVSVPAQAQQTVPLPNGIGTLTLNEHIANGSGSDLSELEVRALHLNVTLNGATIDLIIVSAYSGIAFNGALSSRPANSPPIEPSGVPSAPVPGGAGGNPTIPTAACPDPCYMPLPVPNSSQGIPGVIEINHYGGAGGDSSNGSQWGYTSVDLAGLASFEIDNGISHSSSSGGGSAWDYDGKGVSVYAFGPGGLELDSSTGRSVTSSSYSSGPYETSHYLDAIDNSWSFYSPAGAAFADIGVANASDEAHYGSYSITDTRSRAPSIYLEFDPAAGTSPIVVLLTPVESSTPDATTLSFSGFVVINGQYIPIPPRV